MQDNEVLVPNVATEWSAMQERYCKWCQCKNLELWLSFMPRHMQTITFKEQDIAYSKI